MYEFIFASKAFTPHGICLLWEPVLLWLFVVSDSIIAISYFSIPIALAYFVSQRKDLEYKWVFVLFSLFIFACGATHIMSIITIWKPLYALTGIIKGITAFISVITAILLWPLIPKVLLLPSPAHLMQINKELEEEINLHKHTKQALHDLNTNLDNEVDLRLVELQQLNETLSNEKEKYKVLLNTVADGIYGVDLEGKTIFINPAACQIFNITEKEIIGKSIDTTINACPNMNLLPDTKKYARENKFGKNMSNAYKQALSNQEAVLCLNNKCFPVEFSSAPFKHNDEVVGYVVTFRDISAYKNAQSQLILSKNIAEEAQKQAEIANQAKTHFLSRMSHELRTPMNAILGFSQLLDEEDLTEDQHDDVTEILAAGKHLLELINEVLELAKIESGKYEVKKEKLALIPIIESSLSLVKPIADKNNIRIINEIDLEHELNIIADETRLKQVLVNLLSNAIKYNRPEGLVTLSCQHQGEKLLRIKITDTGNGMTKKELTQLFQPFERLNADASNIEGTGIGLVITKHLVELMAGNIGVSSNKGEGSCFWIDLIRSDE
ncbi:MAG: PAS domain-containing protein [Methylococcaceae bacterium]|nr:PAS domain-containing protein [Methylococcaceae bacterium]